MRKRGFAIILILIMSVLCTACGSGGSSQAVNALSQWVPQDEQSQQLVQLLTPNKNAAIVSYTTDDSIKNVKLGCRYYNNEDGETSAYDPQYLVEDLEALQANEKTWIIYAVFSSEVLD